LTFINQNINIEVRKLYREGKRGDSKELLANMKSVPCPTDFPVINNVNKLLTPSLCFCNSINYLDYTKLFEKERKMKRIQKNVFRQGACLIFCLIFTTVFYCCPASAQNIAEEWNTVKVPSAPEIKYVLIDSAITALLLLDFNKQTCNSDRRPRCINSIPKVQRLLSEARAKSIYVVYSLSPGALVTDIAKELAPLGNEPVVISGPDKFLGTDLEKILKVKNIKTIIVTGTAAHGAVLYTASEAAFRGMQVVVPVDGMSAENTYAEQYVVWNLANAPLVSNKSVLTRIDMIKYR
jgi:nicotinamidase-related amidase